MASTSKKAKTDSGTKKTHSKFDKNWLESHDWLRYDNQKLFCSLCIKHKKKGAFVTGSTDFQHSSLVRHAEGDKHKDAKRLSRASVSFSTSIKKMANKSDENLNAQLRTVLFVCKEGLAIDKFSGLIELQIANGANITGYYKHHDQVEEMIHALSETVHDNVKRDIANSDFIGIIVDESCDVAVYKKLIIYVQVVIQGEAKVLFCENRDIPDGTAQTIVEAINDFLAENNVPPGKVAGLGSDGAPVMTGKDNGVGAVLKRTHPLMVHTHCIAHKLALAVSQAAKTVDHIKDYQLTINHVYKHFQYSAVRYNNLRDIQQVLQENKIALKQPHAVRWLSLHGAVDAIHTSWAALVAVLGEEAGNGDAVAVGLSRKIKSFKFVAYTCILMDILPLFTKLSKVFQTDCLEFEKFNTMMLSTTDSLKTMKDTNVGAMPYFDAVLTIPPNEENRIVYKDVELARPDRDVNHVKLVKNRLVTELITETQRRFPEEESSIINKFNKVLSPKKVKACDANNIAAYGLDELGDILDLFSHQENTVVNSQRARDDFLQYKQYVRRSNFNSQNEFLRDLFQNFNDVYPDFSIFASHFLSIPLNSAACERGFSAQNRTKTKFRNRLSEARLQDIMRILINGPPSKDFPLDNAASKFKDMRDRRQ